MELVANINAAPESVRTAIRNHGGGHFNHSFFWKLMSPDAKNTTASAELTAAINAKWTSMDNFKVEFVGNRRFWFWMGLVNQGQGK